MSARTGGETLASPLSCKRDRESQTRALGRRAAILAALALALSACGRKGDPEAPQGADPLFPRRYPTR